MKPRGVASAVLRVFEHDLSDPAHFVVTLELVPGTESRGRTVDRVLAIARDAYEDGRVSAVSITDNPGGNPSLSPDVIGNEIFKLGMDVIVHMTCRDMNRTGLESRSLQLSLMGMKNILALTGDYSGSGFGGKGAPVFDLDSVTLICMLSMITQRIQAAGDPEGFFVGCAVSPFKRTEAECNTQYAKLCKKIAAGARFVITQLGYDGRKFQELLQVQRRFGIHVPTMASLYVLTPQAARIMHSGRVPGAVVTKALLRRIEAEWQDPVRGRQATIERCARLAAVLKGLGYKGIHIEGIHRSFEVVRAILDRMAAIEDDWRSFIPEYDFPQPDGFYAYRAVAGNGLSSDLQPPTAVASFGDRLLFRLLKRAHAVLFNSDSKMSPVLRWAANRFDSPLGDRFIMALLEHPPKKLLLDCQRCGDCAIQHVGFLCPESQCPKHIRNGPCGGSAHGRCEVRPEKSCVWVRVYLRLASVRDQGQLTFGCVPPRMWELNGTSSWLNYHLDRDHQASTNEITRYCSAVSCRLPGRTEKSLSPDGGHHGDASE